MNVYLATSGDGSDGNEWNVIAIFTTKERAANFITDYNAFRPKWAKITNEIEEWPVDEPFDKERYKMQ